MALVVAVLVTGPTPTAAPRDGPDVALETVEVAPPDRASASEVSARVDTLAAVVADMRAVRWMICRSDDMPRHQRCEVGEGTVDGKGER